jgi:hypothetical protein
VPAAGSSASAVSAIAASASERAIDFMNIPYD